jgi:hypothetical protein
MLKSCQVKKPNKTGSYKMDCHQLPNAAKNDCHIWQLGLELRNKTNPGASKNKSLATK